MSGSWWRRKMRTGAVPFTVQLPRVFERDGSGMLDLLSRRLIAPPLRSRSGAGDDHAGDRYTHRQRCAAAHPGQPRRRTNYLGPNLRHRRRHHDAADRLAGAFGIKRVLLISVRRSAASLSCPALPKTSPRSSSSACCKGLRCGHAVVAGCPLAYYAAARPWRNGVPVLPGPIRPALGGWLTDNYDLCWVFYINLPIGIIALRRHPRVHPRTLMPARAL